jgi:hypothetical protein
LFDPDTAARLATSFVGILTAAAGDPNRPALDLVPDLVPDKAPVAAAGTPQASTRRSGARAPARAEVERRIIAVWSAVLRRPDVRATDNFFDVGGNSLLLVTMHARVCAEFGVEFEVRRLFDASTPQALAGVVVHLLEGMPRTLTRR